MIRYLFFIFIVFCFTECDTPDRKLLISNLSKDTIYYRLLYDTLVKEENVKYLQDVYYMKISANDSFRPAFVRRGDNWEYMINHESKDSSLNVFYFNADTVRKYDWKNIIQFRKYQRFSYKVKDLDSLHWSITYYGIK